MVKKKNPPKKDSLEITFSQVSSSGKGREPLLTTLLKELQAQGREDELKQLTRFFNKKKSD